MVDEIDTKCNSFDGNIVIGTRQPIIKTFTLDILPSNEIQKNLVSKVLKIK